VSNPVEGIVRPFQTPDYAPPRQYFNAGQIGVPNVIIRAGRNSGTGQGTTLHGSYTMHMTFYCAQYVNEQKRTSGNINSF
jgi:hypothetical protein